MLAFINATVGSFFNLGAPNAVALVANKLTSITFLLTAIIVLLFAIYFKKNDQS